MSTEEESEEAPRTTTRWRWRSIANWYEHFRLSKKYFVFMIEGEACHIYSAVRLTLGWLGSCSEVCGATMARHRRDSVVAANRIIKWRLYG